MKKVNNSQLMEVIVSKLKCEIRVDKYDALLAINRNGFQTFCVNLDKNKLTEQLTVIKKTIEDYLNNEKINVVDSANYHPNLFEEIDK